MASKAASRRYIAPILLLEIARALIGCVTEGSHMKSFGIKSSGKVCRLGNRFFGLENVYVLSFSAFALFVVSIGCSESENDGGDKEANNGIDSAIVGFESNSVEGRTGDDNRGSGTSGSPSRDSGDNQPRIQDVTDAGIIDSSNAPDDASVSPNTDVLVDVAQDIDAEFVDMVDANEDSDLEASVDADDTVAEASVDAEMKPCVDCCADGFERGTASTKARLVAKLTNSPEGVTVCPNGDVFVALLGLLADYVEIARVPLDGSEPEIWVRYTGRLFAGLSCDRKGRIFAAGLDTTDSAYAVMVTAKGDPGTPLPIPSGDAQLVAGNGIVAIDRPEGLLLYVSDNVTNLIALWKERPDGQFDASIAATDVVGANGLSYDSKTNTLLVGGSQENNVLSFEIAQDGSLGAPQVAWTRSELGYVDGITIDENGVVYVASWTTGEIVRTSDDRVLTTDVINPASLAFRGGTLLITDFKILAEVEGGLYAIDLGVCGALAR